MISRKTRVGFVALVATILAAGSSSDAAAKAGKKRLHDRRVTSEGRKKDSAKKLDSVAQQPVRLGAMRYYGGPKSPMWRGPVEN
jgi:hypothetical protein